MSLIKTNLLKINIKEKIFKKCNDCNEILYRDELEKNLEVCPKCDHHMYISARKRLYSFLDNESYSEIGSELQPKDFFKFNDLKSYKNRLNEAQKNTYEKEALVVMQGTLYTMLVVVASFEFSFLGGSMSSVVGAKFVLAVEKALFYKCPLICFSASIGARMQESFFSLMQMAKTSASLAKFHSQCLPYISVLTNPTMGGVSASLAMLGDVNIAEPKALIGFAGPRIIEQTVIEKLPVGFQSSEFMMDKGIIDMIIRRQEMKFRIAKLLSKIMNKPLKIF